MVPGEVVVRLVGSIDVMDWDWSWSFLRCALVDLWCLYSVHSMRMVDLVINGSGTGF